MGDRIVINITDGVEFTPSFYGHWCGLRAVKTLNDIVREKKDNGIHNLFCNFIVEVMEGHSQQYSFYAYNCGDCEGAADWDNYTWTYNASRRTWTTTDPEFGGRELTIDEAEEHVRRNRPNLYEDSVRSESRKGGFFSKRREH